MTHKPSYEELQRRVKELEQEMLIRTRVEEVLRDSENRYRSLVETSSDWLWEVNADGRYTYVSSRAWEIFGYAPEEVVGRTPFDLMPEEEAQRVGAIFAEIAAERRSFALLENVNLHRDGRRVVLETSGVPVFGPDGEFMGYRGVDRDITERKRFEEALRHSEEEKSAILNSLKSIMIEYLDPQMRIIWTNGARGMAGGQLPEELIGKHCYDAVHGLDKPCEGCTAVRALETGKIEGGEFNTFDGRTLLFCSSPVLHDQVITGVVHVAVDISERKQMEDELRKSRDELELRVRERTAELEKANQELRQIPSKLISVQEEERKRLASELHDGIGQRLVAVKLSVETALLGKNQDQIKETLEKLQLVASTLRDVIKEIRNIYTGLRPTLLDNVGLVSTLEWFCGEFESLHPNCSINLQTTVKDGGIPEELKVVIFRITQEALNNVAKHSSAERVDVSLSENCNGIELAISDDGVGMNLDQILQTSAARGLGFTTMRERAELTGGSFSIVSASGEGTTVRACWPTGAGNQVQRGSIV